MAETPPQRWITVPNWEKFQHYQKKKNPDRAPVWIKLYTELNSRDDWLALSLFVERRTTAARCCGMTPTGYDRPSGAVAGKNKSAQTSTIDAKISVPAR